MFIDETGFPLIPPVRKTWASREQTPMLRHWVRREKLSVISELSVGGIRGGHHTDFFLTPA